MKPRRCVTLAAVLLMGRLVHAQTTAYAPASLVEVTVAYSADRANGVVGGCGCFWMSGAKAEANVGFPHEMSFVAELTGEHAANIDSSSENLSFVSYLFGPRFSWRSRSRLVPFGQILVGGAHGFDALFPTASQYQPNPDAFAFAPGGGVNINLSPHFALRGVQADYLETHFPNSGSDRQDHLRLSAGFVIRFGTSGTGTLGR
jgi:outer membrane immunogenic protein